MERISKNSLLYWSLITLIGVLIFYLLTMIFPLLGGIFIFVKTVLAPFLIALIISYVLNPIVTLLTRKRQLHRLQDE